MQSVMHGQQKNWVGAAVSSAKATRHDKAGPGDQASRSHAPLSRLPRQGRGELPEAASAPVTPEIAMLKASFANAPTGCWLLGQDQITLHANPALQRLLGRTEAQMTGSHLFSHIAPECRPMLRAALAQPDTSDQADQKGISIDLTLLCADERRVAALLCLAPQTNGNSLVTVTDMSESLRREQSLRMDRDRVIGDNGQLARGLSRLAACLRQPSEVLTDTAGMLDGTRAPVERDALRCRESGGQLARMLDDMEVWAAQLNEPQPLARQLTELSAIIGDVLSWAAPAARKRGIRLINDLRSKDPQSDDHPLDAMADGPTINQVLRRLVDNAIRFTPAGGTLRLSGERGPPGDTLVPANRGWVAVRVTDNGIGIPEHRLSRLRRFDRPLATPDLDGMTQAGFGLLIADRLANRMGGAILLDCKGQGVTASLTLPAGQ